MAPPRRRRFPANRKPKVDHSSYVQSLFREFLQRNQTAASKPAPVPAKQQATSKEDANRRTNPYRESIERMLQQQQQAGPSSDSSYGQEQQTIVKQFFQLGKTNQPEKGPQRMGPLEPVYARFKRREGSDQFVKSAVSPGGAPPGGLIQWLEDRKRERLEREQRQQNRTKKVDEYLNLPDNFFSGRTAIKLPFDLDREPANSAPLANKTLSSFTSAFVPPVASTPLDQQFPVANSPIISDPDEIPVATTTKATVPKPKPIVVKDEDFELIKKLNIAIDRFSEIFGTSDPVDRNFVELRRLRAKRPILPKPSFLAPTKPEDMSMVVKVQLGCDRKCMPPSSGASSMDTSAAEDSTFDREVMQLVATTPLRKKKRMVEVDPLLTYSPPAPKLDPNLRDRLPAVIPRRNGPNVTLNTSFLTSNGSLITPGGSAESPNPNEGDSSSMVIRVQLGDDSHRRTTQRQSHRPSVSCQDSTFAREVLQLTVPSEVRLRQLDPLLLYSPPYPKVEPEKKQICRREPDYSFLDSPRKPKRPDSEFAFDDDQENFGPIFPSQDGPRLGANTTIDFNESLSVEDPFELRFSQGSIWERI